MYMAITMPSPRPSPQKGFTFITISRPVKLRAIPLIEACDKEISELQLPLEIVVCLMFCDGWTVNHEWAKLPHGLNHRHSQACLRLRAERTAKFRTIVKDYLRRICEIPEHQKYNVSCVIIRSKKNGFPKGNQTYELNKTGSSEQR